MGGVTLLSRVCYDPYQDKRINHISLAPPTHLFHCYARGNECYCSICRCTTRPSTVSSVIVTRRHQFLISIICLASWANQEKQKCWKRKLWLARNVSWRLNDAVIIIRTALLCLVRTARERITQTVILECLILRSTSLAFDLSCALVWCGVVNLFDLSRSQTVVVPQLFKRLSVGARAILVRHKDFADGRLLQVRCLQLGSALNFLVLPTTSSTTKTTANVHQAWFDERAVYATKKWN